MCFEYFLQTPNPVGPVKKTKHLIYLIFITEIKDRYT